MPAAYPLQEKSIVKGDLCLPDKSQIAREILAYLSDHPDAEDTLEGIVQWWLLERKIKYQNALVKAALDDLISMNLIHEQQVPGTKARYQINHDKEEDVRRSLGVPQQR